MMPRKTLLTLLGPVAAGLWIGASAVEPQAKASDIKEIARGNPLWTIPLEDLTATRERPIFSPSRRPLPEAAEAPPPPPPAPPPRAPSKPQLALIGTVVNTRDGYGVFVDEANGGVVRLKAGEQHQGWIVEEIGSRDAVLTKDGNRVTVALPARRDAPPAEPVPSGPIFYPEH